MANELKAEASVHFYLGVFSIHLPNHGFPLGRLLAVDYENEPLH
jgi:hypothetical protein